MKYYIVVGVLALSACSSAADPYTTFSERLAEGASCAELFEIRNRVDPADTTIEQMNSDLRGIGCYSAESTRTPE